MRLYVRRGRGRVAGHDHRRSNEAIQEGARENVEQVQKARDSGLNSRRESFGTIDHRAFISTTSMAARRAERETHQRLEINDAASG